MASFKEIVNRKIVNKKMKPKPRNLKLTAAVLALVLALSLPVSSSGETLEGLAKSSLTYYDLKDNSLVGWWKLNEGSGYNTTADSSGNGNTGTLMNMNLTGNATSGWTTSGKFGNALLFDGVND